MKTHSRFLRPLALILAGCSIGAMAVSAIAPEKPRYIRLGEIGMVRNMKDALVFRFEGREYVLRYHEWQQPMQNRAVHYSGTVYAHLLDKAMLDQNEELTRGRTGADPVPRNAAPAGRSRPVSRGER